MDPTFQRPGEAEFNYLEVRRSSWLRRPLTQSGLSSVISGVPSKARLTASHPSADEWSWLPTSYFHDPNRPRL